MSVYDKDVNKLWFILITTILLAIMFIGYSYSYNVDEINNDNLSLMTVYNTGRNACMLNTEYSNSVDCLFTVMGYNKTNNDLNYKIMVNYDKNNTINNELIDISLINKKDNNIISSFDGKFLEIKNNLKDINVIKNSEIFDEYILRISTNKNMINDIRGKYLVNISVIYN